MADRRAALALLAVPALFPRVAAAAEPVGSQNPKATCDAAAGARCAAFPAPAPTSGAVRSTRPIARHGAANPGLSNTPASQPCPVRTAGAPPRPCHCPALELPSKLSLLAVAQGPAVLFGLAAEASAVDHIGVRGLAQLSVITSNLDTNPPTRKTTAIYGFGAQALYYPFGEFSGLEIGTEVSYRTAFGQLEAAQEGGLGVVVVMPVLGFKALTASGFTLLAEVGPAYRIGTEPHDGYDQSGFLFIARLGLGASF